MTNYHKISGLNIIPINKLIELKVRSQTWPVWVLCPGYCKVEIKMSVGLNFRLHALGKKSLFQCCSCWQNSILNNCRTQVPVSLMAVTSQLLKAFCILCQVALSIFKSVKWEWKSLSCVWLFVTLWTVARQAPLSPWDFPGKNTGVGCHFPTPGGSFQPRDWTQIPCLVGL